MENYAIDHVFCCLLLKWIFASYIKIFIQKGDCVYVDKSLNSSFIDSCDTPIIYFFIERSFYIIATFLSREEEWFYRSYTFSCLQEEGEFDWSPAIQSAILGSFYWCYILSQIVGGVLTQYFGTKTVFGGSQLLTAICSLLMPSAAEIHYGAMIALRSIQGIASVCPIVLIHFQYFIRLRVRKQEIFV